MELHSSVTPHLKLMSYDLNSINYIESTRTVSHFQFNLLPISNFAFNPEKKNFVDFAELPIQCSYKQFHLKQPFQFLLSAITNLINSISVSCLCSQSNKGVVTENAELSIDLFQGDPGANNNVPGPKGEKGNLAPQVTKLFYFVGRGFA